MIGSIIFIIAIAGAVAYLAIGVQKNKKAQLEVKVAEPEIEELKPKATKPKATKAAKPKKTVTNKNKSK